MSQRYERTIAMGATIETEMRKSRFICSVVRISTEEEARLAIDETRKLHWNANHHCTAWRIGPAGRFQRSNDDGEPAGTAGTPMLEVLAHRDVTDTLAIVTRYFGGTRLGTGGLIRAYGSAVSAAVEAAGIVERRPLHLFEVTIDHVESGRFEHALRASTYAVTEVTYNADNVMFSVQIVQEQRDAFHAWIAEASSGKARVRETEVTFVDVPVIPERR